MTEESKRKIEALKHCSAEDNWCYDCPAADDCVNSKKTTRRTIAKMALEVIDELLAKQPKWTPTKERFPEKNGVYLVTAKDRDKEAEVQRVYWDGIWLYWPRVKVTAWMPLPEPYSGEA